MQRRKRYPIKEQTTNYSATITGERHKLRRHRDRGIILSGAKQAPKHRQGSLDGLCGLYAVINAVSVLLASDGRRRPKVAPTAMQVGLSYLSKRNRLEDAMNDGMATAVQYRLLVAIVKSLQKGDGPYLIIDKPLSNHKKPTRRELFLAINNCLFEGSAVLACLGNTHEHYTVIIGVTQTRYLLQDSNGLCWISKKCLSISTQPKTFRHLIYPKTVISLTLQQNLAAPISKNRQHSALKKETHVNLCQMALPILLSASSATSALK